MILGKLKDVIALLFLVEGILIFLSPNVWKKALLKISTKTEQYIRISGVLSMLIGLLILYLF